jgi:class 3 adenylate cyclase
MAQEGFRRKLAAILSADVEGYSHLMGQNEEQTIRTLTSYRTTISDLVQQYRGRVVDTPGDTQRNKDCCSVYVVVIDGEQKFACSTMPQHGMNIVVDRADPKAIRKQRLLEYKEGIKSLTLNLSH